MAAGVYAKEIFLGSDAPKLSSIEAPSQTVEKVATTFEEFKEKLLKYIEAAPIIIHKTTLSKMVRRMEELDSPIFPAYTYFPSEIISWSPQMARDVSHLEEFTKTDKSVGPFRFTATNCSNYSNALIKVTVRKVS